MDILFLSHCVPNPPNKGEKIRAYQEITALARSHRVHLACIAREPAELPFAKKLLDRCASVEADAPRFRLPGAMARFAAGECLNIAYYRSAKIREHVLQICERYAISTAVAYTFPMVQYVPDDLPLLLDLVDVDSEKWFEYARRRRPSTLYRIEAERIRAEEIRASRRAMKTFLAAPQETELFEKISGHGHVVCCENGVDFEYFDPERVPRLAELENRRFVVFVGTMDYYPNIDAAVWFAREVMPELRRVSPQLEFLIVGNSPSGSVRELASSSIRVVGGVPDVRPYVAQAAAVVAPLRMARGIQNKVLEALALGRTVLASTPVAKTFGGQIPLGIIRCDTVAEFCAAIAAANAQQSPACTDAIRDGARARFNWAHNLEQITTALDAVDSGAPRNH